MTVDVVVVGFLWWPIAEFGLYKSELINPQRPWKTVDQVEIATLHYLDWFNNRRLYEENGDIPPAELEQAYYRQQRPSA